MAKLTHLKSEVKRMLQEQPNLRDNDNLLCAKIWMRELNTMGISIKEPSIEFFKKYAGGIMSLAPSVKRVRAKLQEECPNLRGKTYVERKGKLQKKWKRELGYRDTMYNGGL